MFPTAGLPVRQELLTRFAVGHHGPIGARRAAAARLVAKSSLGAHGSTTTCPQVFRVPRAAQSAHHSAVFPEEERPP